MLAAASASQVLIAVGLLVASVVALGVILLTYRSRMLAADNPADAQRGLLDDLRRMRDCGELTLEEYDSARRSLAAKMRGDAPAQTIPSRPAPLAPPRPRPTESGALVAPPGYDLTGQPLPKPPKPTGTTPNAPPRKPPNDPER